MIISLETLGTFINRYLTTQNISINELARKTKIAHSTLDRWIAGDYKKSPNLDALHRLADFTGVDLCHIVELIYPQTSRGINPDIARLAEQISHLSVPAQELIDSIILGLSIKSNKQNTDIGNIGGREGS